MIAIDSNILIYAHRSATPEHERAKRAIEEAAVSEGGFGFALSSVGEFWSVATHPKASGRPSEPIEAAAFIRALVEDGGARIWAARPGLAERMLQLAVELDVRGPRIFDLQVAIVAREAGATEIWTHDRSFARVPGLEVMDPIGG